MTHTDGILKKICLLLLLLLGFVMADCANAQHSEQDQRDQQRTRTAQAVSQAVYNKIQKAQESIDAEDFAGALIILKDLESSKKILTMSEQTSSTTSASFITTWRVLQPRLRPTRKCWPYQTWSWH